MRFITNEKLDEYCFKNRLIPPKLRRSLYTSAEITGFQPPTPTTFKSIGNKNKLRQKLLRFLKLKKRDWNSRRSS